MLSTPIRNDLLKEFKKLAIDLEKPVNAILEEAMRDFLASAKKSQRTKQNERLPNREARQMVGTSKGGVEKEEKKFLRYERRFRLMLENAAEGILLADVEKKKFCHANKHFRETLGYSSEEIKSLGVRDIHPRRDLLYVLDQFEKLARSEIAVAKDIPVKRKDGSLFYADISALRITQGGKQYVIGIFRDITGREGSLSTRWLSFLGKKEERKKKGRK